MTNIVQLPKSTLRWAAVGLLVSSTIIIIISLLSGVTLADLARLGYIPFTLAAVVSSARLAVQVLRFRLVVVGLAGQPSPDLTGAAVARMGSEFVALSTPSMVGGEFVRAAWLSGKGIAGGKALWLGYFEVIVDVYVGSALGLISAWYAFSRGAAVIGSTILVFVSLLVVGYSIFFLVPALRGVPRIPRKLISFAAYFIGGARARRLESVYYEGSLNFSVAARQVLKRDALPVVLEAVGLTMLQALMAGLALWIILTAAGLQIDLFSSTLVAFGATAIAAIPISVGGSGITELAVASYLSLVFGFTSWAAVVLWRIASFQVVLAVSGIAFVLLVRRGGKRQSQGPAPEDSGTDSAPV